MRYFICLFLVFFSVLVVAEPLPPLEQPSLEKTKEKTWWQKRDVRSDIYYPHKAHYATMEEEGDSCLLCHSFQKNAEHDDKKRAPLNTIANEPLEAICHDCHLTELRAPWRCDVCHDDVTKIWPADHNSGYIQNHAEDSKQNADECRTCHVDQKFCTDCHFRRDTFGSGYHPLGYRSKHGLEARMMPANCSKCHNYFYCRDCHDQ